jgi:hypothetical protein
MSLIPPIPSTIITLYLTSIQQRISIESKSFIIARDKVGRKKEREQDKEQAVRRVTQIPSILADNKTVANHLI